jgi:hypothetical protein
MIKNLSCEIPHEKIHVYSGMLTDITPADFVKKIEDLDINADENSALCKWHEWAASHTEEENKYVFGEQKRFNMSSIVSDPAAFEIYEKLTLAIEYVSGDYAAKYDLDIGALAPISISKYHTGAFMGPHADSDENSLSPTISVVFYLNDDYEGGEINFPNQGITIKPKAGDIVVFPSRLPFLHESKAIISGTKYMAPGFWNKL